MADLPPLQLVQQTYQAFGQGDVITMLSAMTEDFEWDSRYPAVVPLAGRWQGHAGVLNLLKTIGETVDVLAFEIQQFVAEGGAVVVLGYDESRAKATGRVYHNDWVHIWTVQDGKLSRVRTYNDTAAAEAAFV